MADWFEDVFGFEERTGSASNYGETRAKLKYDERTGILTSDASDRQFQAGFFSTPSLLELRRDVDLSSLLSSPREAAYLRGRLVAKEVVGDVSEMHTLPENEGALFQAASQFNCLEHTSQRGLPEHGITCYAGDRTQGPACATACAPGTVVRNYFASVDGADGQTQDVQVKNLQDVELAIDNATGRFFQVQSGYTLAKSSDLERLGELLGDDEKKDEVVAKLRIGVQADTEVTGSRFGGRVYDGPTQIVTQAYCSAVSVSYSGCSPLAWEAFAKLVLFSAYESTLYVATQNAIRNRDKPGARRVFLTALGGGVFGNPMPWIEEAMRAAFTKFRDVNLEIFMVSYGGSTREFAQLQGEFRG